MEFFLPASKAERAICCSSVVQSVAGMTSNCKEKMNVCLERFQVVWQEVLKLGSRNQGMPGFS